MLAGCATPKAVVDAVPVASQPSVPQCGLRYKVIDHLAGKYGEAVVAAGIANTGGLVEVLANYEKDTWSIIVTDPGGLACLVAAGEGWRSKEPTKPKPQGTAL